MSNFSFLILLYNFNSIAKKLNNNINPNINIYKYFIINFEKQK